ncbi:GNAT family N-acetyltransferase [Flavisphingomonas formosensis]|uniref:GNAT family N-acetyltransferase n=1 Tax=Flavisphingomonas formosensis TaxID=861534 RepID=UPI001E2D824E|nr:GNAT family N-acetyltransferase [Sphingomonas formosensis]
MSIRFAGRGATGAIDVRMFDDLDAVARDAEGALDRMARPSLYDRIDWLRLTRAHVLPEAVPLIARAALGAGRCWLFLRAARGGRAEAYASWYTLRFAPVFAGPEALHAPLLGALARALRGRFSGIDLAPMAAASADLLIPAFAQQGWWAARSEATANWVAHTAGKDFAAYWAERPSRLRNTLRRKLRDSDLAIAIHERFDDAEWDAYEAVYRASWKPAEGSPDFLRALARAEGAAGTLRLGIARRAGVPVAAQFWTVEQGVATIHKLAHIETEKAGSPGTLLSEALFRHVLDRDQPRLVDFGTGDDGYKADWMDERRVLERVALHNLRSLGGIARAGHAMLKGGLRGG